MTEIFTQGTGAAPPPSSQDKRKTTVLIGVSVVFLVLAVCLLGVVLFTRGDGSDVDTKVAEGQESDRDTGSDTGGEDDPQGDGGDQTSTTSTEGEGTAGSGGQVSLPPATTTSGSAGTITPGGGSSTGGAASQAGEPVEPVSVVPSNTRRAVPSLKCTKQPLSYVGDYLIDGDPQTGWGALEGDGAGQSASIDFGTPVNLKSVGLIPGYARVAPRSAQGCDTVQSFGYNRFVPTVRWEFDDGTSVEQQFEARPEMQTMAVDVTTTKVRLVIVSTQRPAGADDDTILSEAAFTGVR